MNQTLPIGQMKRKDGSLDPVAFEAWMRSISDVLTWAQGLAHTAVTVSAPLAISVQALSIVNDVAGTITEVDTGALANSDTKVPTSKAVTTAISIFSPISNPVFTGIVTCASLTVTGLSDGKIPIHTSDAIGFQDSVVENTALSTWVGTTNITTLGSIVTGSWHGTTLAVDHGGTGAVTAPLAATALGVGTGDSPVFVTVKCSGLTDGYIPKHTSDAVGLENSPIYTDGTNVGIGTASPGATLHIPGQEKISGTSSLDTGYHYTVTDHYMTTQWTHSTSAYASPYNQFIAGWSSSPYGFLEGIRVDGRHLMSQPAAPQITGRVSDNGIYFGEAGVYDVKIRTVYGGGFAINTGATYLGTDTTKVTVLNGGNVGIGVEAPTATLHLKAGTAAVSTGPLKFTVAGAALLTAPEVGVLEPFGDDLWYTITTGVARKSVVFTDGFVLTDARVPFATTNGRLTDDAGWTFTSATNTVNLAKAGTNAQPGFVITGYNDQETYDPYISIRKSHHDTFGTITETPTGSELGGIYFYGVSSTPAFAQGFHILVVQNGASGAGLVPTNAYFETCSVAGVNTNQLVLSEDDRVGIGTPTPAYKLDVVGNIQCSTGFGCNSKHPQTAYPCAAWDEPGAGAYGVDSAAHMAALVELVKDIQAALIANGIMAAV